MGQKGTESHTLPGRLGREEGFCDAFDDSWTHTDSVIANKETHAVVIPSDGTQHHSLVISARIQRILHECRQSLDRRARRNDASRRILFVDTDVDSLMLLRKVLSHL